MGFIRHFIGFFRPADKGLNIFNALSVGCGNHFRHLDNPMSLHFAVHIVIVNLFQVIGEPFIFDCQQTEESGLSCTLSTHKAEHNFKLTARFEHSADCSQHEQP